ncbi:MAG: hypothetical protein RL220_1897 [Bacteroidota bacterium]
MSEPLKYCAKVLLLSRNLIFPDVKFFTCLYNPTQLWFMIRGSDNGSHRIETDVNPSLHYGKTQCQH